MWQSYSYARIIYIYHLCVYDWQWAINICKSLVVDSPGDDQKTKVFAMFFFNLQQNLKVMFQKLPKPDIYKKWPSGKPTFFANWNMITCPYRNRKFVDIFRDIANYKWVIFHRFWMLKGYLWPGFLPVQISCLNFPVRFLKINENSWSISKPHQPLQCFFLTPLNLTVYNI